MNIGETTMKSLKNTNIFQLIFRISFIYIMVDIVVGSVNSDERGLIFMIFLWSIIETISLIVNRFGGEP